MAEYTIQVIYGEGYTDSFNVPMTTNVADIKRLISERPSFATSPFTKNLSEGEFDISTTASLNDKITMEGSPLSIINSDCRNAIKSGIPVGLYVHPSKKNLRLTYKDNRPISRLNKLEDIFKGGEIPRVPGKPVDPNLMAKLKNSKQILKEKTDKKLKSKDREKVSPQAPFSQPFQLPKVNPRSSITQSNPQQPTRSSISIKAKFRSKEIEMSQERKFESDFKPVLPTYPPPPPPTSSPETVEDEKEIEPPSMESFFWVSIASPNGVVSKIKCPAGANKKTFVMEAVQQLQFAIDNLLSGDLAIVIPDGSPYGKKRDLEDEEDLLNDPYINRCVLHQQVPMLCNFPSLQSLETDDLLQSSERVLFFSGSDKSRQDIFKSIIRSSQLNKNLTVYRKDNEVENFRNTIIPASSFIQPNPKLDIPYTRTTQLKWDILGLSNSFLVQFSYGLNYSKELLCYESTVVGDIIATLVQSSPVVPSRSANDYMLKILNRNEYLHRSMTLGSVNRIREYLSKSLMVQVALVDLSSVLEKFNITDPSVEYATKNDGDLFSSLIPPSEDLQPHVLASELDYNFQVRIISVGAELNTLIRANSDTYQVEINLYHGNTLLCSPLWTKAHPSKKFNEWIGTSSVKISQIPRAAKICFTLYVRKFKELTPIGGVNFMFYDYVGQLRFGNFKLPLWPNVKANPLGACSLNSEMIDTLFIDLEFPCYCEKIIKFPSYRNLITTNNSTPRCMEMNINEKLANLVNADPLYRLTLSDKDLIWTSRAILYGYPPALPKVLQCVDWTNHNATLEALRMLPMWATLSPTEALQLLDFHFVVPEVRQFAVDCLRKISDIELCDYLLQLVQVLKYEPYHDSPLSRFLLQRALQNRAKIGHPFFWHLKAELNIPDISERYMLLLEAYICGCGDQSYELMRQNHLSVQLRVIAENVKSAKKKMRIQILQEQIAKLSFPEAVQLPLSSTYSLSGIIPEKCKFMDSFTVPLWIVFSCADNVSNTVPIIFKSGDDLRADILTLQMFRIMDKLWQNMGLDLQMTPYLCTATEDGAGMIEVVVNSRTAAAIQKEYAGVTGALKKTPLAKWLREQNDSDEKYDRAVHNFIHSLAGYCVATYVLGIGDRHNDNIMVTKSGQLFHIDFAHFLGNVQMFQGIKRERAPFVLTKEFLYVMGVNWKDRKTHPHFQKFVNLCCEAFNILRRSAHLFITLFSMMLSTGIPELRCDDDILYLRNAFALDKSESEARKLFEDLIEESLNTKATTVNFLIHNLAHANT